MPLKNKISLSPHWGCTVHAYQWGVLSSFFQASCTTHVLFFRGARFPFKQKYGTEHSACRYQKIPNLLKYSWYLRPLSWTKQVFITLSVNFNILKMWKKFIFVSIAVWYLQDILKLAIGGDKGFEFYDKSCHALRLTLEQNVPQAHNANSKQLHGTSKQNMYGAASFRKKDRPSPSLLHAHS